jgi:voltage-gated potassium channel
MDRRALALGWASAITGVALVLVGLLAAVRPVHELYHGGFAGYDPPFDAIAGVLLLVLSPRIRDRTPIAWFFSLLVPLLAGTVAILSPDVYSISAAVASSALVAVMYPYRGAFYRGSATSPQAIELMIGVVALFSLLFGIVGARRLGGDFTPPIGSWSEAIYFTITTISTNGSDINPLTPAARWFVVALILLGVGTFLSAVVVLFMPFLERRLERIGLRLERAQMQELGQHVIVCGASPEAVATARSLREQGIRVVIVSPDERVLEGLKAEGLRTHAGDPSSEEVLKLVGIDRARSLVACQDSDAANLLTVITARALQPQIRIVAVATSDQTLPKLHRAGANEAISVVGVAAQLMSAAALDAGDAGQPHAHSIAH